MIGILEFSTPLDDMSMIKIDLLSFPPKVWRGPVRRFRWLKSGSITCSAKARLFSWKFVFAGTVPERDSEHQPFQTLRWTLPWNIYRLCSARGLYSYIVICLGSGLETPRRPQGWPVSSKTVNFIQRVVRLHSIGSTAINATTSSHLKNQYCDSSKTIFYMRIR